MNEPDEEFLRLLQATFLTEASEHLQAMTAGLQQLEKAAPDARAGLVETIYREAHSLKGAARAVSRADIEQLCQAMEGAFAAWKRGGATPAPGGIGILLRAADAAAGALEVAGGLEPARLAGIVAEIGGATPEASPAARATRAESAPPAPAAPPAAPAAEPPAAAPETVRVPVEKLDRLIRAVEEFLPLKMTAGQRSADLREVEAVLERWRAAWSDVFPHLRDAQHAIDRGLAPDGASLVRLLEFLDWNQSHVRVLEEKLRALARAAGQDRYEMDKRVNETLEGAKRLAMLPCQTVLASLPKTVRDICAARGKEAELVVQGGATEVDKSILEALKDPLVHIVRNCVDHGIEEPAQRERRGKPRRGTIRISVSQAEGNRVGLVIEDDGGGIDLQAVREAAVALGLAGAAEAGRLDRRETAALIFHSGVSTRRTVSEISGRGLGMAIVREKVERLGGTVSVETYDGRGTIFRLSVPLARGTFRGVVVQVEGQPFVIPSENLERIGRMKRNEIRTVENRETITVGGEALSLVHLADVLELDHRKGIRPDDLHVVVLVSGGRRIAVGVDEVLHETEVLVKPLGPPLYRVRNISAATVLGGGHVVPVLNTADIMKSAVTARPAAARPVPPAPAGAARKGSLLVVEDSITARMLLKNILEAAGHRVRTAVDGVDALTSLRTEEFDLVISDVDMPRMNGLELTARIRSDRRLAEKPVILVTALASPEDRERGAEVGANAYIVKSSFDQGNLLAAVERLL